MNQNVASAAEPTETGGASLASIERALPALSDIRDQDVPAALVQLAALQARVGALQQGLIGRLVILREGAAAASPESDRFLRIDEVATTLCKSKDWIYRNWKDLPFAVRHGGHLAFSKKGLSDYMRRRIQAKRAS